MIAEYGEQKKALAAPAPGLERFGELMASIAAAGPQRTFGAAGTAGALGLEAKDKERRAQQLGFTEKQIELAQKKKDAERAFKKDVYEVGKKAYDDTYKQVFEALKEQGQNDRQASANATQLASTAMQVAESARGHTLTAQAALLQLKLGEQRADKDMQGLALKALTDSAKELGGLLKDPSFAMSPEGTQARQDLLGIINEVKKRGGMKETSTMPTITDQPTGKTLKLAP